MLKSCQSVPRMINRRWPTYYETGICVLPQTSEEYNSGVFSYIFMAKELISRIIDTALAAVLHLSVFIIFGSRGPGFESRLKRLF